MPVNILKITLLILYKTSVESVVAIKYCQKQLGQRELASTLLAAYSAFCFVDSASVILFGCKQKFYKSSRRFLGFEYYTLHSKPEIY